MPQEGEQIRSIAGYILKNNARLITSADPAAAAYVKSSALTAFTDQSVMLRNAAQQVLIALLGVLEPKNWPEALAILIQSLDSPDPIVQEVRRQSRTGWCSSPIAILTLSIPNRAHL